MMGDRLFTITCDAGTLPLARRLISSFHHGLVTIIEGCYV